MSKKNILIISDSQFPYEHDDALAFCKAVQKKYKCDRIVHVGDLADFYNFSQYDKSPDAETTLQELTRLRETVAAWSKVFPSMEIVLGNHDRRIINRITGAGVPEMIISGQEILDRAMGTPKGWSWHDRIHIKHTYGDTYIIHGDERGSAAIGGGLNKLGVSVVKGHHHSKAYVKYLSTPNELKYEMSVGCLIDDSKLPFSYNDKDILRPILSVGVLVDGYPQLEVMRLNKEGKWIGKC